jgi:hypothetical protein
MPSSETLHAREAAPLDHSRLFVVLATIGINVIGVALLSLVPWSDWRTGVALNIADNSLLLGFVLLRRDGLLARLILFGLAVGFAELAADAWLVDYTRTLDYSVGSGPMLWRSPIFMPFAWETVAVQLGYIGALLWERFGKVGLVGIGVMGAVNIPYYEQMARYTRWWTYRGCHMISSTPYYIIVGEFGIAIALALLAKPLRRDERIWPALALGVVGGIAIFVCYAVAYGVTDGFHRA